MNSKLAEITGEAKVADNLYIEKRMAKNFVVFHKKTFGNGPQKVSAVKIDNYVVVVADKVLNKFEKSLCTIDDGPQRVFYTRKLLFEESKEEYLYNLEKNLGIAIKEVRSSLDTELDKNICTFILE